jgi:hypothetical protein
MSWSSIMTGLPHFLDEDPEYQQESGVDLHLLYPRTRVHTMSGPVCYNKMSIITFSRSMPHHIVFRIETPSVEILWHTLTRMPYTAAAACCWVVCCCCGCIVTFFVEVTVGAECLYSGSLLKREDKKVQNQGKGGPSELIGDERMSR